MPSEVFDPDTLARQLREAEPGAGCVELFTDRFPDLTWSEARSIARARDRLRTDAGEQQRGYKLGWTSLAMREALGIEQPNWGTLWHTHDVDGLLELERFRHPKIEPEFVYRAGATIGAGATAEDVLAAADGWAIGLEVVDPRFADFGFRWLDNTADNSSAGGVVISDFADLDARDPASLELTFGDGETQRSGTGQVVMGSPAAAVAWLANELAHEASTIEPGMVIFTGGVTAPVDARRGTVVSAECRSLGLGVRLVVN